MADTPLAPAGTSKRLSLQTQLRVYEAYARSDSYDIVADQFKISPELVRIIVARIPTIAIPLTTSRKLRACLDLENLAHAAVQRIRQLMAENPLALKECLQVLHLAGAHYAGLLSVDTPQVQHNVTYNVNADEVAQEVKRLRDSEHVSNAGGNGSRLSKG